MSSGYLRKRKTRCTGRWRVSYELPRLQTPAELEVLRLVVLGWATPLAYLLPARVEAGEDLHGVGGPMFYYGLAVGLFIGVIMGFIIVSLLTVGRGR